ncbi:unnamed protein product, partial [Polarella glacialis]
MLEVGAYCGYSSLRMAIARPGSRILTLEANPSTAVIARSVVSYAGLAHLIDVRVGHSEDVLPLLGTEGWGGQGASPGPPFDLVFFDQRGSRYVADLKTLESTGCLAPGAVVVCDNVLKPGAPALLWHVLRSGLYETQIMAVTEYAMPGVEDWMSMSVYRHPQGEQQQAPPPPLPASLRRLEWEADQMRNRNQTGGVDFEAWAQFAATMRSSLASSAGIAPEKPWAGG